MGGTTYLAVANSMFGQSAEIRSVDASGTTTLIQTLSGSASAFEYFAIAGESYLAVANTYADDQILHYTGTGFTEVVQTLDPTINAQEFSHITINAVDYLAVVSNDGPVGHAYLYQWTGTGMSLAQTLPIDNGSSVETFFLTDYERDSLPYAQALADNGVISGETTSTGYQLHKNVLR